MRGRQKAPPPIRFFPVTSTNPQNFLTYSFNPFSTLVSNFKAIPSTSPKLLNLNQERLQKSWFFKSNRYKIEVLITSFTEILGLPNFGHITTSTI